MSGLNAQCLHNQLEGFPEICATKKKLLCQLVVSTHLKNISQNGNLPQIGVKIKND